MSAVKKRTLTAELARRLLDYNPDTGVFRWRYDIRRVPMNGIAGRKNADGYWGIGINKEYILAHRLAWLYVHGEWPEGDVDHVNRVRDDNRITNLRVATRSQNIHYSRPRKSNKSGYKGVHFVKYERHRVLANGKTKYTEEKWCAQIKINGHSIHLGYFPSAIKASEAYQAAAKYHFKEFAYLPDNALPSLAQNFTRPMQCPAGLSEALLYGATP